MARRKRVRPISCMTEVNVGAIERCASSQTTRVKSARNAYVWRWFESLAWSV